MGSSLGLHLFQDVLNGFKALSALNKRVERIARSGEKRNSVFERRLAKKLRELRIEPLPNVWLGDDYGCTVLGQYDLVKRWKRQHVLVAPACVWLEKDPKPPSQFLHRLLTHVRT